ncbi:SAP domain-containing protein [Paenibacillus apiarius]|uniref:SAP domain-containing protein n=1 Tax=Paenibacillus apiarius TaxID=46240 RepID=UPI003B3A4AB6
MIKIISGVYGYREGASIKPKTANDAPFSLPPQEEERLVKRGVAEYLDGEPNTEPDDWIGIPEYHVDMKAEELRAIAKKLGLSFKVGTSKVDMVEAIDKFLEEHRDHAEPNDEDGQPPVYDPSEAVQ